MRIHGSTGKQRKVPANKARNRSAAGCTVGSTSAELENGSPEMFPGEKKGPRSGIGARPVAAPTAPAAASRSSVVDKAREEREKVKEAGKRALVWIVTVCFLSQRERERAFTSHVVKIQTVVRMWYVVFPLVHVGKPCPGANF